MKIHTSNLIRNFKFEYKITLTYLLFGMLWILFSDKLLDMLIPNNALLTKFQTFKGIFFILVTSVFLYVFVKRHMLKLNSIEAQRIKSEIHYKALFNDNQSIIVLINPDNAKIEDANLAACKYYGLTYSELCSKTVDDFNTSSHDQIKGNLQEVRTEKLHHLEAQHRLPNGEVRDVEITSGPIQIGNKSLIYSTIHDITERKRKEQELFESEFRFSKLYENGPFGMVMADIEFRFNKANATFCTTIGYSEAELQQLTFKDITHPDDLKKDLPNIQKLIQREINVYKTEKRYIRKDGTLIWGSLTVTSTYNSQGEFLYNLGIIEDISWRKQSEFDLILSKKLLAETESVGKVGGWEFNINTLQTTWTDEVYRIHEVDLGLTYNVNSGINFYTPKSQPIIEQAVQRAIEFGESFDLDLEIITAKGNMRSVHTVGKADLDNRRVYGFFQDITERKLIEKELLDTEEYLRLGYETAGLGIWKNNLETMEVEFDEQARIHYGFDKYVVTLSDVTARIHPDDMVKLVAEIEKATSPSGTGRYATEYRVIHPNGSVHWLYIGVRVSFEGEGDNRLAVMGYGTSLDITERKQAEQQILEANRKFAQAQSIAHIGSWDNDLITNELTWSDEMYRIMGFEIGKPVVLNEVISIFPPEELERFKQAVKAAINKNIPYRMDYRIILSDGTERYIHDEGIIVRNEEGVTIRMVGTTQDITSQKLADNKLLESELRFSTIFHNSPVAISLVHLKTGKQVEVNEAAESVFGYSIDEIMNHSSDELKIYENENDKIDFLSELTKTGKVRDKEFRIRKKNNEIAIISSSAEIIILNNDQYVVVMSNDVTERKNSEIALLESEKKFSNIFDSSPIGISLSEPASGRIFNANSSFAAIWGYTREEMIGKTSIELNLFATKNARDTILGELLKHGRLSNKTIESQGKYGNRIILQISSEPIELSGVNYFLNNVTDITERIKIENEIKLLTENLEKRVVERTAQLEAVNKELEAFSYSVSHDLRAPLRHINGYVDLLNNRFSNNLPEKALHYLTTISDSTQQMGTLIDDLLQFSRTGRQELNKTIFDMDLLVREVIDKIKQNSKRRKIKWSVQKLPQVFGDSSMFRQVWVNLIDNAVKYTRHIDTAAITIAVREEKNNYVFSISDNGVGFDMKYAHKLFGVFQRLHSQAEFEGTGIGLANVQRIIIKHSGKVYAVAELNKGATFYFSLPKK